MQIDEKEYQYLPMTRFRLFEELKWFHTVLKDVGECKKMALPGDDVSHILHSRIVLLAPEDPWEPFMVVLIILNNISGVIFSLLTE